MKIGILTLHSGFNEGAMLQTYALAKNLKQHVEGAEVEIIDHRYRTKTEKVYGEATDERSRTLMQFLNEKLSLSEQQFYADTHDATFDYINATYDAVVVGSDEVWKLHYRRRFKGLWVVQDDPWKPPFPNVYWLDTRIKPIKIAYAASIGKLDWTRIPKRHVAKMREWVRDFSLVGVRDQRALNFLSWLYPKEQSPAQWVPDPTFAVDLLNVASVDQVREKMESFGVDFSRPTLGIVVQESPLVDKQIQRFKDAGYQVVSLSTKNKLADVALHDKGFDPLEWVVAFGLFDRCITQRMHGCVACLLNNTPFVAVDFHYNTLDDITKLSDLMKRFKLDAYYYHAPSKNLHQIEQAVSTLMEDTWPSAQVEEGLSMFRNQATAFTGQISHTIVSRSASI